MPRRPLDVLEESLGALVTVTLKGQTTYVGRLVGFDQHMNVVLEDANRGRNPEETTGSAAGVVDSEAENTGGEGEAVATEHSGGDTIVIRGDNVVTITS